MAVTRAWLAADLRRRGRSLVVLALLVALATATVLSALAGARRGNTAQERLLARTKPATVVVLANTTGFDWKPVARLPEVAAITGFAVDYSLAADHGVSPALSFPPTDDATMRTIEKPVLVRGRVFDPTKADEVVVTPEFVRHFHRDLGDTIGLHLPTQAELQADKEQPPFHGPKVTLHIVGVGRSPWFGDQPGAPGAVILSPGLAARYPRQVLGDQSHPGDQTFSFINTLVRLKGGESAIPAFRKDLARATGRDDLDVWDMPAQYRAQQRTLRFEALCLAAFGLAALAAACFLVGQAIARYTGAATEELRTVQALGMTPREAIRTASVAPVLAGALGAGLALPLIYLASGRFPLGAAGLAEPHPGRSLDWVIVAPGLVVAVALVALAAVLSARRTLRAPSRVPTRSVLSDAVTRGRWPVPVVIGTRFALEPGRGRSAVPVRPAIVGAVIGLLGITSAFTFAAAVHDAATNPARFGQTFDQTLFLGLNDEDFGPPAELTTALRDQPAVEGVLRTRTAVVGDPSGASSVSIFTYTRAAKPLPVVMTSGRMPRTASEVALAPQSLRALGAHVGDRVALVGSRGRARYLVTGTGFVPAGPHNNYDDGGWVTPSGYERIVKGFKFDVVLLKTRPGTSGPALAKAIAAADPKLKGAEISPPDQLGAVGVIRDVQVLPVALGAFLVLLALAAVGHGLATAVRRRSGDLAVLRALGLTPWQCRWVVVTQSSVLGLIGLVFGVPLGIAVGRMLWRIVAGYTPLQYVAPLAGLQLLLTIPAALVAANLLGAWPGQRAARLRVHQVLRAE